MTPMPCPCMGHDEMCPCQNRQPTLERPITKCFVCGAQVDTREFYEGGADIEFFQFEMGRFVCSETCLDQFENDEDRMRSHA